MAFIDGSVLTVALPRLREDFGADFVSVQWVLNGYVLALASLTLIGGALADVYGRARMLAFGCIVFGLASVACALAPSVTLLIAARVVQGIAAAIVTPASLALIGAVYPREERNQAIGVWAAASALTTAGGPILGGWLTENFGWPLVFWINPPLALLAVVLLLGFAPEDRREKRPFDMVGAVILATSLGVLAWALSQIGPAEPAGTPAPAVLPITVAIVAALGGFAFYAVWERTSDRAMTPPRLWRNRAFVGLNLATVMIYAGLSLMFFLLPFDLIERRGLSATEAGLTLLPFTLGVGFLSSAFGALADKIGARAMLVAGPLAAALAFLWMALTTESSLTLGVLGADDVAGPCVRGAHHAADRNGDVERGGERRRIRLRRQQHGEPDCAARRHRARGRSCVVCVRLRDRLPAGRVPSAGGALTAAATVPSKVKSKRPGKA